MYLGLYLEKPMIKPGHYPEIKKEKIIEYRNGTIEQGMKIGQFFFDNVNEECGISVAPYEYDFWNPEQCKKIINWIEKNNILIKENSLDEFFKVIDQYCKKAIELDTGVEIDL